MHDDWDMRSGYAGEPHPFDGAQAERVVPADGDPEAEVYRANLRRQQHSPRVGMFWWSASPARPRHRVRRWFVVGAVIALGLLFIKPLVVLATVAFVLLFSVALVSLLAIGALLLAARFVLGGRFAYLGARGPLRHGHTGTRWFG
jgi:hypothetical protein